MYYYEVEHQYDVDGGIGDAVRVSDIVARFDSEELANSFVKQFGSNEEDGIVYDCPYNDLYCGKLVVNKVKVSSTIDEAVASCEMWWRNVKPYKEHEDKKEEFAI